MSKLSTLRDQPVFANASGESASELRFWLHWAAHEPFLLRLCIGWVGGNAAEARELLSSAMLKAWEGALKSQEEIGNYRAWLAKIVRHHSIDLQRRQNRDPQVKIDPELLVPIAEQARITHQASPENNLLKEESYTQLLARMDGLPLRLREVMMLRAYQNMSYKEIGQHLQITTENARKRVQMARSFLKNSGTHTQVQLGDTAPTQEREATEAILLDDHTPTHASQRFAMPVAFAWDGLQFEWPVLHEFRPMRLAQKAETLRKYLERHPGGWKKELELARLCWALGDAQEAITRMAAAWERQPHMPELALAYIRHLQAIGDSGSIAAVALEAAEAADPGPWQDLLLGHIAAAQGDLDRAALHWQACPALGGTLQLARTRLAQGRRSEALELLQIHIASHPMDREAFLWVAIAAAGSPQGLQFAHLAQRRFPADPYAIACERVERWRQPGYCLGLEDRTATLQIAKMAPNSYLAMATMTAFAHHAGLALKAAQVVSDFLHLHPQHRQALTFAARLAQLQGREVQAAQLKALADKLFAEDAISILLLDLPLSFLD